MIINHFCVLKKPTTFKVLIKAKNSISSKNASSIGTLSRSNLEKNSENQMCIQIECKHFFYKS